MKKATLYIVACIDTEGPANYALDNWEKVYESMLLMASSDFRAKYRDSAGGSLKLSYFIMDWTGFNENPTGRELGYGKVYEHYEKRIFSTLPKNQYCVGWHYHHPYKSGKWINGGWNRDWNDNKEYENQINHMVLDRKFFPSVYRAGGTIESNEQSEWLEKWIPFDFSSRAPEPTLNYYLRNLKPFVRKGFKRPLWNWSKAPADWRTYHPSSSDYRMPGDMERLVFRCLDINSPAYKIGRTDIESAFKKAMQDGEAVFSFFTHDFCSNAASDVINTLAAIKEVGKNFTDAEYIYETAVGAASNIILKKDNPAEKQTLDIEMRLEEDKIFISSNHAIYSKQPWVVVKDAAGNYKRIDMDSDDNLKWRGNIKPGAVKSAGAAAVDNFGNSSIKRIDI